MEHNRGKRVDFYKIALKLKRARPSLPCYMALIFSSKRREVVQPVEVRARRRRGKEKGRPPPVVERVKLAVGRVVEMVGELTEKGAPKSSKERLKVPEAIRMIAVVRKGLKSTCPRKVPRRGDRLWQTC